MEDIIINGVSVNSLKQQREAIREGASKIIAENIEKATALTRELLECEDYAEVERLAALAYQTLDTVQVVSGVSGVTFFLPYYEEYGDNDGIITSLIDNTENEAVMDNLAARGAVRKLYSLLGSMETQSRDWHSSTC